MPAGCPRRRPCDRLNAWLSHTSDEYVVVLGPHVDRRGGARHLRGLRLTAAVDQHHPGPRATSTASCLRAAMASGVRDVVTTLTTRPRSPSARPRLRAVRGAARPGRRDAHRARSSTVFSPKGGVGKTTIVGQPGAGADREGRPPGLPGRPRPRLRRRRDHHAAVPDALDRAGHRLRGLASTSRCSTALLTRHQDSLMVLAAPTAPRHPRAGHARCWSRGSSARLRETFDYIVDRHRAGLRRADAHRARRDRRGRRWSPPSTSRP